MNRPSVWTRKPNGLDRVDPYREATAMLDAMDAKRIAHLHLSTERIRRNGAAPSAEEEAAWHDFWGARSDVLELMQDALEAAERCIHGVREGQPCAECDSAQEEPLRTGGGPTLAEQQDAARGLK